MDGDQPFSTRFADVYFSRDSGLDETRHVFLQHNQLAERWRALSAGEHFCIAETGFGTGLNFLAAWQRWDACAPPDTYLHFVSTEKYPLSRTDLQRALTIWPELRTYADELLAQYRDLTAGWQHFSLGAGRITLTLLIGDLFDTLPQLDAPVDAWFLDGFAPARNPQMWQPALYQRMAELSRPGATVATFTSVGDVRRGLQAAGFAMRKVKGYGRKREMLCGQLEQSPQKAWQAPWFARPGSAADRRAVVIGGGLAGACSAHALARRGWQVTLLERQAEIAQAASGNPQGILYCKLSPHHPPLSRFVQSSYQYSLRLLARALPEGPDSWQQCGVLQLGGDAREQQRQQGLASQGYPTSFLQALNASQASTTAGVAIEHPGLWFPGGGWVSPPTLCRTLLQHPLIEVKTHSQALQLQRVDTQWKVLDPQGETLACAACVVLCTAQDTGAFSQSTHLPLKAIRGQITHLPATSESATLRTVLCADGYISPNREGTHHLGASFRFDRLDLEPSGEEDQHNLQLLEKLSPALHQVLQQAPISGARVGLRCTSPDYLPLIGPLAAANDFARDYAILGKDASARPDSPAPWHDGLYVNIAHGSRGLISAPLSGELLAAWMGNEPLPLPRELAEAVHPSRFLLRQLVRQNATDRPKARRRQGG
ncbi:bifunctional tRNA (5-methylaminomethyl-2-thiouridine)(34)-methyltransferase MnmD/FAD-dependent 5-carboxymethylaminomethyl-2-thiouridine(34) oxidoreductase MnmC [Halopseudomonas maritima]|uniref:bifunctional tRNA (5-methylaminomethyl-2-thiouridine)(34)-methyltransferase MnmD/FAD-dependent 5-carboxymethylaminomethyl-2-thiouridine(34) oxidoreductase MnmC n=1 Tax=Halopseudomonas maritima TaxID=2918528 RepID=UPI001EEAEFFC|nr:bifunctional tRNA (5-methylaminomethyl-2-thiouridine)(34)-methyltransferase MnmD/FAD-dependent 5-carboxymethylaminomethyl-2-thiouridine(34) oxidoreductase MnmC [Halopseudomonas maritima]